MKFKFALFASLLFLNFCSLAQTDEIRVKGKVTDSSDNSPIIGATLKVVFEADTAKKFFGATNIDGFFNILVEDEGVYLLQITYLGYSDYRGKLEAKKSQENFKEFKLSINSKMLQEVTATGMRTRVEQRGDTTEYNANSYQANPDANAEDLVTKMPGFSKENGEVTVQGEKVRKVTVDGKEYFGDDATAALKNLPAEIIERVQVFDEQSEQSRFTGFDDGNSQKTVNIVTKSGMNQGQFGRIYSGYGTDNRYLAGANINLFGKNRRVALIGMSNNVNMQNFSSEDLLGVLGTNSTGGRGGRSGGGRPGGFGGANEFMVGQQNGITSANAFGINYSDKWGKKMDVTGSYFFNQSTTIQESMLSRELFIANNPNQFYNEISDDNRTNLNHRVNLRLVWNIDSSNSIVYRPRFSLQQNRSMSNLAGNNSIESLGLINLNDNNSRGRNLGYDINNDLLYRRKLSKVGRTVSLSLRQNYSNKDRFSGLRSLNEFYGQNPSTELIDQEANDYNLGQTYSAELVYTEPVGKKGQLMFSYNPSYSNYNSERRVNFLDPNSMLYNQLDTGLSNEFDNIVNTQKGGISYNIKPNEKANLTLGLSYQSSVLQGNELFPTATSSRYIFPAILPNARLNYALSKQKNLMFMYRSSSRLPSISQLQPVIDNSNPLQLSAGNTGLKQEIRHFAFTRFGPSNTAKGTSFFVFVGGTLTTDYISNASWIAPQDNFEVQEGVFINRGAQFSQPTNMSGYRNVRSFISYGMPVKKLKSNLNFNIGYTLSRTPGLINNLQNNTLSNNLNSGVVLSSNISPKIDYTLSYTANYNTVSYSFNPSQNNNFFFQNASIKFNWMPWKGLVINSETYYSGYAGLGDDFNQQIVLWNGGIGYKFLKNQRGELRITAFDLLKQNNNISRMVTENYIQDSEVVVLQRFFLLNFTYQIRHFKSASVKEKK